MSGVYMNRFKRCAVIFVVAAAITGLGCSSADAKEYDISPIFPLSADKCAKYNGEESGEGLGATCMVTKADCERAVADWEAAMREGGVNDAMQFSCD